MYFINYFYLRICWCISDFRQLCNSKTAHRGAKQNEIWYLWSLIHYTVTIWPCMLQLSVWSDSVDLSQNDLQLENGWLYSEIDWYLRFRNTSSTLTGCLECLSPGAPAQNDLEHNRLKDSPYMLHHSLQPLIFTGSKFPASTIICVLRYSCLITFHWLACYIFS